MKKLVEYKNLKIERDSMILNKSKLTIATFSLIGITMTTSDYALADGNWTERIKINGDFRYRYEFTDQEAKVNRHRNRLRLRLGIHAQVNDDIEIGAMLATGSDDPTSTNQSFDNQSSTKDIRLDQAYFAWKPLSGLAVKGGKFKNPFYRPLESTLLWSSDMRPEGVALQYKKSDFFANASFFYLEERTEDDDSLMVGGQVGYQTKISGTKLTIGTSFFDYEEMKGRPLSDFDFLDKMGNSFGNTLNADGNFVTDYREWEVFGDITFKVGGMPLSLFADYVINTAAEDEVSDDDTAYLVGFKIGAANKKPGAWDFRYDYRRVESDALFGVFSDADFVGAGTDGKGHVLNFGYQIAKGWKFAVTYFMNNESLEDGLDFERVQVDLKFKF